MSTKSYVLKPVRRSLGRVLDKLRYRGTYVDYWTFVHFGTGLVFGFVLAQEGMRLAGGLGVATTAFVLWELVEPPLHRLIGQQFPEKITNQIVDVLIGIIGCVVGFALVSPFTPLALLIEILDFFSN